MSEPEMNATLFYYTGTGNSLWTARQLSQKLGEAEPVHMKDFERNPKEIRTDVAGLVFPVYIWGVPGPVVRFVESCKTVHADYWFAVAVNGGQVSGTLVQLKKRMERNGLTLASGFEIQTPSNYIPWGGSDSKEKITRFFTAAEKKIDSIVPRIEGKETLPVEKGPLWQRILLGGIYRMSYRHVPGMDKKFWVDEKCDHCGICSKVCPAENITMIEGKPVWNHRCEQCLACIQWCPREAIQYGKKTPKYQRYHQPEVVLKDVIRKRT
jgi:ferredoxin